MQRFFTASYYSRFLLALSVGLFSVFMQLNNLRAEVIAVGDVDPDSDPDLPIFGSPVDINGVATPTGLIRVGIDDIGRLVIDIPSFTNPLVSEGAATTDPSVIIGEEDTAIGEVVITGFGSEWEARGLSIVGDRGLAFLSLIAGARYVSKDDLPGPPVIGDAVLIMGNEFGSSAITTVDGFGSRLQTAFLLVGREGDASIDVINRGNIITTFDASIGVTDPRDFPDNDFPTLPALDFPADDPKPTGRVTLSGLGSRWTVQDSLTIGNDGSNNETGIGILQIGDQALVQVGTQESTDRFLINRFGRIELTGGTLRALIGSNANARQIQNNGVIKGDGFIDGRLLIDPTGELRNAASTANLRETLLVSGDVVNNGTIESLGGEMEFLAPVTNNLEIVARDAVMRFRSGLDNNGVLVMGGDTTIHGDIDFSGGGDLLVLSDSETLVVGDLTFSASNLLALSVGDAPGTLDVAGVVNLGGATLALDYSAGIFPQAGDTYQILQASEGINGLFASNTAVAGGGIWNIDVQTNRVLATFTGVAAVPIGADFDGSGTVDGADLAIWQANYGRTAPPDLSALGDADGDGDVDGRDFLEIQRKFGGPPLMAEDGGNFAAVPEPSALLLVLSASVCLLGRRRS